MDYIEELEKQNEELRQKLAVKETIIADKDKLIEDLDRQLQDAISDADYYRDQVYNKETDWNSP